MTLNWTLWTTIKLSGVGGGLIYLENKTQPAPRNGCSVLTVHLCSDGEITVLCLLPPEEISQHKQEVLAGLPVQSGPGCCFLFWLINPWTLQDTVEASRTNKSSLARVAAFVDALLAGYFGEAWPMCLGGVRAYWPRWSRGGHAVKGFHLHSARQGPPSYRIRSSSLKQSHGGWHHALKTSNIITSLYILSTT